MRQRERRKRQEQEWDRERREAETEEKEREKKDKREIIIEREVNRQSDICGCLIKFTIEMLTLQLILERNRISYDEKKFYGIDTT